ncbi:cyclic diguanylate phosphodiesterase [Salmonella enterica subsp. enterica serovar Choleraesuis]|nr:cyclic diguanylate phosphodiesterase [Salmonella enterica subsp. enterica serovar Choleraesuis]
MTARNLSGMIIGLLVVVLLFPIAFSVWLAHRHSHQQFEDELHNFALRIERRAERVIERSDEALRHLQALNGQPCSPAHIRSMQRIIYLYRHVQEVFWLQNGEPQCTSSEELGELTDFPTNDKLGHSKYDVWLTLRNNLGISREMVAFSQLPYVVLVHPEAFIDTSTYGSNVLNAALVNLNLNYPIASSSSLEPEVIELARKSETNRFTHNGIIYIVHKMKPQNISIITWSSVMPMEGGWMKQLYIWLPLGLGLSLIAGFITRKMLKQLQSPQYLLQNAIQAGRIEMHYQPVINLSDGRCVGAEALVRWPLRNGSLLTPNVFIPLAEQSGLITPLTELIIRHVLNDLGPWLSANPDKHVSINLAAQDLQTEHMFQVLSTEVQRWNVKPHQVAIEITERSFANPRLVAPVISRFHDAGHAIYIDDFGTGYANLNYLQTLQIDILKIDKSFIDALEYNSITPHIIEMAKSLHLKLIAEGIETQSQADWLVRYGVEYGQGWLYSKALPKQEFFAWYEKNIMGTHRHPGPQSFCNTAVSG